MHAHPLLVNSLTLAGVILGVASTVAAQNNPNPNAGDDRVNLIWTNHTPSEPGTAFFGVGKASYLHDADRENAAINSFVRAKEATLTTTQFILQQLCENHVAELVSPECRDKLKAMVESVMATLDSAVTLDRTVRIAVNQATGMCSLARLDFTLVFERFHAALMTLDPNFQFASIEVELLLRETQSATNPRRPAPR